MASVHPLVVRPADTPRPASLPPIPGEVDLQEVLRKVWRRKTLIVGVTIALTVIAALIIFQITPLYTAYSVVMINDRNTQVVDVEAVVSRLAGDAEKSPARGAVLSQRGGGLPSDVCRNDHTQTADLRGSRDADELSLRVEERPAGKPRVNGRRGANDAVDRLASARCERSADDRDNASRRRDRVAP